MKRTLIKNMQWGSGMRLINRFLTVAFVTVLILTVSSTAYAQSKTVQGRVTTDAKLPLASATVTVKGTSNATMTDANGAFTISAAKGAVLVISNVGYADQEITVGDNANVSVQMSTNAQALTDVVVVG